MERLWKAVEKLMHFILCRMLHIEFSGKDWDKLCQFVQFGMVGLSNTLISYIIYLISVMLGCHYLIASILGFLVSVMNAYYWNDRYVFRQQQDGGRVWWKAFLKTFLSYAGTGLVLNNILLILWVDIFHIPKVMGPIINLFITIPLNFLLNKYWAFKKNTN